eukprot:3543925-Amphidinium_carterae.1
MAENKTTDMIGRRSQAQHVGRIKLRTGTEFSGRGSQLCSSLLRGPKKSSSWETNQKTEKYDASGYQRPAVH